MHRRLSAPTLGGTLAALLLAVAMLAASPAQAATRGFIVTDFDSLRLEGPIDVTIDTGRGVSARGEGDADLLERLDLSVSARVLTIRLKRSPFESRRETTSGPLRLTLTAPTLRRLQLAGSGSIKARGLDKLRAEIMAAGSGSIAVSGIASDTLSVVQAGSGAIALAGAVKSLTIRVSGSGSLDAKALTAADLDLSLDGSASVDLSTDRTAKIVAAGPGSVIVTGKAACTVRHSGSGAVRCGGRSY